ncbi:hypothetical protein JADG_000827 [Aureobasidium aubasidani]|nr:hypothetical protein JADG_000827 [Aureobasidium pullulans]
MTDTIMSHSVQASTTAKLPVKFHIKHIDPGRLDDAKIMKMFQAATLQKLLTHLRAGRPQGVQLIYEGMPVFGSDTPLSIGATSNGETLYIQEMYQGPMLLDLTLN